MSWSLNCSHKPVNYCVRRLVSRSYAAKPFYKKNWDEVRKASKNTNLALSYFDGLYTKVYGKSWPSLRLGLLSPKKQCAVLNSFVDTEDLHDKMLNEYQAISLQRYYKKHLRSYTRYKIREQIMENKRARKRELLAKSMNVSVESIDLDSVEASDVSDSEIKLAQPSDISDGFSSAEDLHEMFSDRRMDEDERYFINRASTRLSLEDFVPATELVFNEDTSHELDYYDGYNQNLDLSIDFRDEPSFETDNQLNVYTFPRNSWSLFPQPSLVTKADLFTHYLLDGASILAVIALDVHLNDTCADYCAAPGGKALALLMTMKPKSLLCNDNSKQRLLRLSRVMKQYAPDISYVKSTLSISNKNAMDLVLPDAFDKILVDVPCSNDRHSVEVLENNIFKRARTEERLQLPHVQSQILISALKSLKPNGALVYSTCTMSPVENDGVVQRALTHLKEEAVSARFAVMNLKEAFRPFRGLFKFNTNFKYGQQVLPSVCSNFGPMYISKIKRVQ